MANLTNHWERYPTRWSQVRAPLRVNADIVAAFRDQLAGVAAGPALLLGITPELVPLFDCLDVVDKNPEMLSSLWPGDHGHKKAHEGNWLDFASAQASYAVVAGDGSLNNVDSAPLLKQLLQRCHDWLAPDGQFVCRLFERPVTPFSMDDLCAVAQGQVQLNFHAFKWMMAMHLAERGGMKVPVQDIFDLFQHICPDIDHLPAQTGWLLEEIRTIEIYDQSEVAYVFPSRHELLGLMPDGVRPQFVSSGTYDLSECCPLVTFKMRAGS